MLNFPLQDEEHWDVKHNQSAKGFGGNQSVPQGNQNGMYWLR